MDDLSKRRKWRRWLAMVEAEVNRLQNDYQTYNEVRAPIAEKPEWAEWLENIYLVGVSLAIRRLADANPRHRTVSLVKLLQDMEAHSECLSRRSALRSTGATRREQVNRLFDKLAGEGAVQLPQAVVRQWREDFEKHAAPFCAWVDHRVAHHDLTVDCPPPQHQHVEQILGVLHSIVGTLRLLVGT